VSTPTRAVAAFREADSDRGTEALAWLVKKLGVLSLYTLLWWLRGRLRLKKLSPTALAYVYVAGWVTGLSLILVRSDRW